MKTLNVFLISITLSALFIVSCGSDDTPEAPPVLTSLDINASNGNRLDLIGEETTQLVVTGFDQFGDPIALEEEVSWSVSNSNAEVTDGLVTPLSVGVAVVTASVNVLSAEMEISIWDSSKPRTEIFVSDAGNFSSPPWQILRFFGDGSYSEVFTKTNLGWPQDIVVLEEQGVVLISNISTNLISKYDVEDGTYLGDFATGIGGPTRMEIGSDNLLYVLQWRGDGLVRRYQLDGTFVDNFTSVGVNQSIGMDWDSDGNLYVSSFADATVRKFDSEGNDLGIFINTHLTGPTDIWFDASGNLLVNDWNDGLVEKFTSSGAYVESIITGLTQPEGIDYLSDGNMLIGNGGGREIKEYNPSGNFVKNAIVAGSLGLIQPNAITVREVNQDQ